MSFLSLTIFLSKLYVLPSLVDVAVARDTKCMTELLRNLSVCRKPGGTRLCVGTLVGPECKSELRWDSSAAGNPVGPECMSVLLRDPSVCCNSDWNINSPFWFPCSSFNANVEKLVVHQSHQSNIASWRFSIFSPSVCFLDNVLEIKELRNTKRKN